MMRLSSRLLVAFLLLASLLFTQSAYGQITWNFTYADASGNGNNFGFNDTGIDPGESLSRGQLRKNSVIAASTYLNSHLDGRGTITINWNTSQADGSGFLASFGPQRLIGVTGSFQNGGIYQSGRSGAAPFSSPDGAGTYDFGFGWNYAGQNNAINASRFDMTTVAIHEIGHGLGFLSFASQTGAGLNGSNTNPDLYSMMDKYMVRGSTSPINLFNNTLTNSNYGSFANTANASTYTNGNNTTTGLFFAGQYAMEVFGNEVPLFAPATYQGGSSVSHVNDSTAVMNPSVAPNTVKRFKAYEIGMLMDIGWNVYNWNGTTGNWMDGVSTLANSRWRTDSGIVRNAANSVSYNTFANQGEAPILPVYGDVTANIVLNFKGTTYTSTNNSTNTNSSVRLSRMNFTNTGAVTIAGGILNFGLNSNGTASVLVPKIINAGTGSITISSNIQVNNIATQTLEGSLFNGHTGLTIEGTGTGLVTLSGNITGTGGITKNSSNFNMVMSGTNNYSGTTTINAGTLSINGNNSSATGAVTVNNGGQLSGTGTVGGAITVNSGGTLQAGSGGIGTLTVNNNVTINSGGILRSELGAGNTADRINLSGGNNILALSNGTVIGLTALGFTGGASSATFLLANLNGTTSNLLTVNGSNIAANTLIATFTSSGGNNGTDDNANLSFALTGFSFASGDQLRLNRDNVGNLVMVFVPVPEPALLFSGAVAMLAAVGYGRKYFARSATKPLAA